MLSNNVLVDRFDTRAGFDRFSTLHFSSSRFTTASEEKKELCTCRLRIAAILGHSDIRMTSRYTHATDRARRAAVESLAGGVKSRIGQEKTTSPRLVDAKH